MPNQVTLTFGGDPAGAKKAFDEVGSSAKKMQDDVTESSEGFKKAGEAADEVDTKAMGFRDTLTGVQDSMSGLAMLSKGPSFEGFLTLGAGIGDLGSGFYNFLIPALEKTKLATLASTAASKAAALGTNIWNTAQKLFNLTLLTSPITWIVLGIVALIAVIVLIATKTDWFQKAWRAAWGWIKNAAQNSWDFIKKIPGWIGDAFGKVANFIIAPYKFAFNQIAKLWNATIGGLSFTVPGWVPGIGGKGFTVPNIPTFHSGGVVPGAFGTVVPILAMGGERVSSGRGDNGPTMLAAGDALTATIFKIIRDEVVAAGGDPSSIGLKIA